MSVSENSTAPYFPMHETDGTNIACEHWQDERSVDMHRHTFYEMFLIDRGSSRHFYMGTESLLIPGDVLIVSPHQPHGLSMKAHVSIYNIQFIPEALSSEVRQELQRDGFLLSGRGRVQPERMMAWRDVEVNKADYYKHGELQETGYEINKNRQGIIHLQPQESSFVRQFCERAILLGGVSDMAESLMKTRYTELVLLTVMRAFDRSRQIYGTFSKENQRSVSESLLYIEAHLSEELNFNELALKYGYSANYFRKIFRDITGFSPVQYVNRLRISIACQLMQEEHLSVSEAAASVGIYDINYFVRMFKKIMGVTPGKINS